MKRHQTLRDLSREHHTALTLALAARRAATSGDSRQLAASAKACGEVFATHLEPHFVVEETTLLPALARAGEQALVARTLREHAALRSLCGELPGGGAATLLRFAELLSAHVRFEERELFEVAQAGLEQ
ncbi:MAG TPA: hemerythrin HHE cation-binding protein [Candidatus Accumulibacter sp.]|uniref:hemerythrin domain-containing protein n=1 Tax=Accumulibacter sp. TaxID=2053492 RepID=UPI000EE459C9|nr:hemerythrin domain-containing protein [Accumulibacter sp.]HCZ13803.1 hemerythrin HHE cation-binding protein [Accumulibacter sp.]